MPALIFFFNFISEFGSACVCRLKDSLESQFSHVGPGSGCQTQVVKFSGKHFTC